MTIQKQKNNSMNLKYRFFLNLLWIILGLSSCLKNDHQDRLDDELRLLSVYLQENDITVAPTASGLYYIENQPGIGVTPSPGDYVLFNFTGRLVAGEKVYGTSDESTALFYELHSSNVLYGPYKMQYGYISPYGVNEGLGYMSEGTVARLIFPSTLGFGSSPVGTIPAYSSLIYDIEMLKIIPDPVEYENEQISAYLDENEYIAFPDENGLYYIEAVTGTGSAPTSNSRVEVVYTASLIDGRILATTGTTSRSLRLDDYYEISGLKEGVKKMKVGGKAIIIVPHNLGFGEHSVTDMSFGYKVPVPPYATIIFEIELKSIL